MKKHFLIVVLLSLLSFEVFAQSNFFKATTPSGSLKPRELTTTIKKIAVFELNEAAMRTYLKTAPMEFKNDGVTLPLEIPMPDGTVEVFKMVESPTLSPEMSLLYPEIKTYTGNGTTDKKAVIRLSLTSSGFNAVVLNIGTNTVYFESYYSERSNVYFNYFIKDVAVPNGPKQRSCNNTEPDYDPSHGHSQRKNSVMTPVGTQLRTFKLALAANAEFVAKNGGTVTSGFNAVVVYANRTKAFYRNELAIDFTLVSGQNLVYTNAVTDPYDNTNQGLMLTQNHNNLNTVLGSTGYDVGHILASSGGSGGGVAAFQSVCNDNRKGMGVSGEGNLQQYSQLFMDQLLFHELGHQFGMSHTFNSSIPVCTTREPSQSVEPGAGATIMSYGFTCGSDDYFTSTQAGPLMQFHTASYEQTAAFLATISCQTTAATTNTPPVVTVPSVGFTIPKSTPFALTGSATDANNDVLSYCWEGTNIGTMVPVTSTLTDTAQPPFFKSYAPTSSPTRTYPLLSKILDGSNYDIGDKLPSVSIVTTHRLTVRDNNASGGGVNNADVTVTVDGNIGPFLETTNLAGIYSSATMQNVTWSVNGTNIATPNVKISVSADGGLTFPHVVLASTPNDGNQMIAMPNITTTTARIKIEAVGNIFFDISNTNFAIQPPLFANVTGTGIATVGATNGTATSTPSGGATSFSFAANNNFTGAPFSSEGPLTTVSTLVVPALPAGSVINSAVLNLVNVTANAANNSFKNEVRVHLAGAYTLAATQLWTPNGTGTITPNPAVNLPNFPVAGGSIQLQFSEVSGFDDPGTDATIASAFITINYTKNGYTYLWSNGQTTQTINNLAAGTYNVTVTDASNGTATGSYTVTTAVPNNTIWNGSTWSNGIPTASIQAVFAGDYTATTNLTANAISVSGTSNVVFPSNYNLTITNVLIVGASSTLTFENNSNLIQINAATNTGNIVYKRDAIIKRLDYVLWSSPVAGQKLLDFTPNTFVNRFYTFDEPSNTFLQVASPAATNFAAAKGYSLRAPNNFTSTPQTFNGIYRGVPNNGNFVFPVTMTTSPQDNLGYNLIGNPYPSTVSGVAFLTANAGSLYFWTHQSFYNASNILVNGGVANYATFSLTGGVAATVSGGTNVMPNGFIQAGQGFMFLTTSDKNVTFTNAMRVANNAGQFFRTAQTAENNKLWLNLTNDNGVFSQTLVAYLPNTTAAFDDGYDAKQINKGNVLSSKIGSTDYAIQSRGDFNNADVVKLNLNIATAGSYTLSKDSTNGIFANNQDYFLRDNLLGTTHNIKQSPYNFVVQTGTLENRFEIVYQSTLSNNSNVFGAANVVVFEQNGTLNISSTEDFKSVKVFDIQGRNIFEMSNINTKTTTLNNFSAKQQVLLVQITNANNEVVTKKVIF